MPLLQTIEEMQAVCSVDVNLEPATWAPYIVIAEQDYLLPVLGATFMATLQTDYIGDTLTEAEEALLPYIQRVIGPLAIYHMTPNTAIRITNNGLQTTVSGDFNQPSSNEVYFMRKELRNMGMNALDALYAFLEANKTTYTVWASDPVYTQFKAYFISSALQFQNYVDISSSRVIYGKLVPMMANIERRYIAPAISLALFTDLKTKWAADTLSPYEQTVVGYLCCAIALYTYQIVLSDRNLVEEIMVINNTRSENFKKNKEDFGDFGILTDTYGELADGDIADAVSYMNQNATDSIMPLWLTSGFYINPNPPVIDGPQPPPSDYNNGCSKGSFFAL